MIAALFVKTDGPYFGIPDVDPWDQERDARAYRGTDAVVAHPPCERWGRYWHGGPSARERRIKGDDEGCFASALASVRRCGGVLEHPEASAAWAHFGLVKPPKTGGWVRADADGFTCCVEQGHYGHAARKATWLYVIGAPLPELVWGPCTSRTRLDVGYHSAAERAAKAPTAPKIQRLTERESRDTDRISRRAAFDREVCMRRVIIESPYAGNIELNTAYAKACLRDSLSRGEAPIASHLLYPQVLDENDPAQRAHGIAAGLAWRKSAECGIFYLDLGISDGMHVAIDAYVADLIRVEARMLFGDSKRTYESFVSAVQGRAAL